MAEVEAAVQDETAFELDELVEADNPDFKQEVVQRGFVIQWNKAKKAGKRNPLFQFAHEPSSAQLALLKASLDSHVARAKEPVSFRVMLASGDVLQFTNDPAGIAAEARESALRVADISPEADASVAAEDADGVQVISNQDFSGLTGEEFLARIKDGGNGKKVAKPTLVEDDEDDAPKKKKKEPRRWFQTIRGPAKKKK